MGQFFALSHQAPLMLFNFPQIGIPAFHDKKQAAENFLPPSVDNYRLKPSNCFINIFFVCSDWWINHTFSPIPHSIHCLSWFVWFLLVFQRHENSSALFQVQHNSSTPRRTWICDLVVLVLSLSYIPIHRISYSLLTVVLSGQIIGWMQKI